MPEKNVVFVFEGRDAAPTRRGISDSFQKFEMAVEDIKNWFSQYQIDSIELWVTGGVETGSIVKLFVSAKGEGGLKIILKPKS